MQSIQQQRARWAMDEIAKVKGTEGFNRDRFKARAAELPAMIRMNGLGQAAAFYKMKGPKHYHLQLYNLLSGWLCRCAKNSDWVSHDGPYQGFDDLLDGITTKDVKHYQVAQAEALALMDWVKKFAKVLLDDDDNNGKQKKEASDEPASV